MLNQRRPMHEMLRRAAYRTSGHMPGHKGKAPFGAEDLYALDTTELAVTDDLYAPERAIAEAERLYAAEVGAAETLFLTNGSTVGIHVMLQLWTCEGDLVILPRNAHLSAVHSCVLGGLRIAWIPLRSDGDGRPFVAEEDVLAVMDAHPEAKALLLTRPDYRGGCISLKKISARAKLKGIRLCVDEAHGAHLPWLGSPASAACCGADAWVQSTHKTLHGLTGSAVLHLRDSADLRRAMCLLRREQTSSPSFLLMLSIDDARAWMSNYGRERLGALVAATQEVKQALWAAGYQDGQGHVREYGYAQDPTRLVVQAPCGGARLASWLADAGVDVEMADDDSVVCILTAAQTAEDIALIGKKLLSLAPRALRTEAEHRSWPITWKLPEQVMTPRRAAMGSCEYVPLSMAVGRIAAAAAGLYPPGVPLVVPGERLEADCVERLQQAGMQHRFGIEGDCILCVDA